MSRLNILALDTTTRTGSVALARGGSVVARLAGDASLTHGQRLPGDLMRVLEAGGMRIDDVDLLAVATGPGSFTGLRVGIAAIQGIALARGLRVVPVPTLEALARSVCRDDAGTSACGRKETLVAAWMDGHRNEVFAAMYRHRPPEGGSHERIEADVAGRPEAVLDAWKLPDAAAVTFVGDGAVRYRALLEERLGVRARIVDPPPLAPVIAHIAFEQPHRAVGPDAIVPVYVRRPDAELARDRREGRA